MTYEIDRADPPRVSDMSSGAGTHEGKDMFALALDARTLWALAKVARAAQTDSFDDYVRDASTAAAIAGAWYPNEAVPALLADVPALRSAFETAASDEIARQLVESRRSLKNDRKTDSCDATTRLTETDEWVAFELPAPADLLAKLTASKRGVHLCEHYLVYDSEVDMAWYTNPYGVDGVLSKGKPTIGRLRDFLVDMASGVEYGPVP